MSSTQLIRLDTFIALCGVESRRGAQILISKGMVKFNGKIISRVVRVKNNDEISILFKNGWQRVTLQEKEVVVIALNKPTGYITSTKKLGKQKIVTDLIDWDPSLKPVGRLDKDSSGLLLFTNDIPILQKLTSPTSHIEKEYLVTIHLPKNLQKSDLENKLRRLSLGVKLEGIMTKKAKISLSGFGGKEKAFVRVILKEGKNRQIRKMFGKFDLPVIGIHRVRIGGLELNDLSLEKGKYTYLDKYLKEKLFNLPSVLNKNSPQPITPQK